MVAKLLIEIKHTIEYMDDEYDNTCDKPKLSAEAPTDQTEDVEET